MHPRIHRRDFLRSASASVLLARVPGLGGALHAVTPRAQDRLLLTVYLRGGVDALNVVVPWSDPDYARIRPGIGIPSEDEDGIPGVLKLDDRFGLHPALAPLMPHWKAGELAPIVCVGSPHPTRSHFDAQDFMEYAAPGIRSIKSGWLNRYLAATHATSSRSKLRALAMQKLLPRSLRGDHPVLAVPSRPGREVHRVLDEFEELFGAEDDRSPEAMGMGTRREEDSALQVGRDTIETLRELYRILDKQAEDDRKKVVYPRGAMSAPLAGIARVVKAQAGLEVACLDLAGWDTHTNQGGAVGAMSRRLGDLAASLAAFADDLGEHYERTLILVMSEFGRTCHENGNLGTDHGHGGCMLALGGAVGTQTVHGKFRGLDEKNLYQGRDLEVTTDFRVVFKEVLEQFLGFKPTGDFFPGWIPEKPLGFLKKG
ncbi:MAG: DUF1501 domain-containing protein [Salinibacterium sp.]|nr:DUF1501 domain-containing protein [Salinibacterium sp.]